MGKERCICSLFVPDRQLTAGTVHSHLLSIHMRPKIWSSDEAPNGHQEISLQKSPPKIYEGQEVLTMRQLEEVAQA